MFSTIKKSLKNAIEGNEFTHSLLRYFRYSDMSPFYSGPNCKFIFIRLHKIGGTSITDALNIPKRDYTSKETIEMIGKINWQLAYKFAFVRNPFARVVSTYNYFLRDKHYTLIERPLPFKEWVRKVYGEEKDTFYRFQERYFMPQTEWILDDKDQISLNKIGKLENIGHDLNEIAKAIGIEITIPHLNRSKKTDYRTYYDEEIYNIVKNYHKQDLENFGYTFDNG